MSDALAPTTAQALTAYHRQPTPLDLALAAWLDAKATRSGSQRTLAIYSETISRFRLRCQKAGFDLDSENETALYLLAKRFSEERLDGKAPDTPLAPATVNQRLAVLSSFYTFARRKGLLDTPRGNPLDRVDRKPDHAYASALPLAESEVARRMGEIDATTESGARDFALLAIGLTTGRRLAELARLTWGDVKLSGAAGEQVTLHFPRTKGGKQAYNELEPPVAMALLRWLWRHYGGRLATGTLPQDAPLWVSLERNTRGHRLTHQAIANVCLKRLGTSKVHALRHSFAHAMRAAGADVAEIQKRLGHASLHTTGRYLVTMPEPRNPFAGKLVDAFGLK